MLEGYDKQKIGGCLAFGCLLTVTLFALGGFGAYFGVKTLISSTVYKYTEPVARELPRVHLTPVEYLEVTEQIEKFTDAIEKGEDSEAMEFSARDINYLISSSDEPIFRDLRDKVYFEFEDGKIKTELSVPLDRSGVKDLRGRFLNGSAELSLGVKANGELEIDLKAISANGFDLPDGALEAIRGQSDFIDKIFNSPRFAKYSKYLEYFEVNGDILTLKAKDGKTLEDLKGELSNENISF